MIYLDELIDLKSLQKIVIPENINKIPEKILSQCPHITSIKCNPNVLKNMIKEDKNYILEIEIYENFEIDDHTFDNFDGVYNFILPSNQKLTHKFSVVHKTSIKDLEIFDPINKKYSNYIKEIIKTCESKIMKNLLNTKKFFRRNKQKNRRNLPKNTNKFKEKIYTSYSSNFIYFKIS